MTRRRRRHRRARSASPFTITGDARSRRIVNSLSVNYSPYGGDGDGYFGRTELSLFWGTRYVSDRLGGGRHRGWSNVVGADIRFDLNDMIDVGARRHRPPRRRRQQHRLFGRAERRHQAVRQWLAVASAGTSSASTTAISSEDRYTRSGPYVTMRLKFDQLSLAGLGLGRR